ncbi:MAG: hypothetical protein LBU47_02760 [Christensenellaceae bacterium]|nr:hypothetical protein [Christensenellaceae bacterium]
MPRGYRPFVPLLAAGGEILWVLGLRRGAAFPVKEGQKEVLRAEYRPKKGRGGQEDALLKRGDSEHTD